MPMRKVKKLFFGGDSWVKFSPFHIMISWFIFREGGRSIWNFGFYNSVLGLWVVPLHAVLRNTGITSKMITLEKLVKKEAFRYFKKIQKKR